MPFSKTIARALDSWAMPLPLQIQIPFHTNHLNWEECFYKFSVWTDDLEWYNYGKIIHFSLEEAKCHNSHYTALFNCLGAFRCSRACSTCACLGMGFTGKLTARHPIIVVQGDIIYDNISLQNHLTGDNSAPFSFAMMDTSPTYAERNIGTWHNIYMT